MGVFSWWFLHADNEDWSVCADAQTDLNIRRGDMSEGSDIVREQQSASQDHVLLRFGIISIRCSYCHTTGLLMAWLKKES